jgi:hypothetical protein
MKSPQKRKTDEDKIAEFFVDLDMLNIFAV